MAGRGAEGWERPGDRPLAARQSGTLFALALVTPTVQLGHVFLPMHFPEVNRLTFPVFDPHSRQPGYKTCAVAVAVAAAP